MPQPVPGIPAVIVPFLADQPFWGQRMHQLGVAPAAAMRPATTDQTMRQRAAELGQQLAQQVGVAAAVAIIKRVLEK